MEKYLTVLGRLLLLGLLGGVSMNVDIKLKSVAWLPSRLQHEHSADPGTPRETDPEQPRS